MSDLLERLFKPANAKDFAKTMKEAQEQYPAPADFLEAVAAYLPTRLYEQYYGDSVPQSFFGFIAAAQSGELFSEEHQWRPFVQQAWSAARERQRTPWSLNSPAPLLGQHTRAVLAEMGVSTAIIDQMLEAGKAVAP